MAEKAYHELCETLAKRRGRYPGKDIPEFYAFDEEADRLPPPVDRKALLEAVKAGRTQGMSDHGR